VAQDDKVKQRIAKVAAEMLTRHQIVGINGGTKAFAIICVADQINTVITDPRADEKMLEELYQLGIETKIA
jgi:DeoR/GlpR family transcriptional regulator of sugar metabolism